MKLSANATLFTSVFSPERKRTCVCSKNVHLPFAIPTGEPLILGIDDWGCDLLFVKETIYLVRGSAVAAEVYLEGIDCDDDDEYDQTVADLVSHGWRAEHDDPAPVPSQSPEDDLLQP